MPLAPAYIVAARRTALGRVGGLHRSRRIEALAAPVITAALEDCGIEPARVEEILVGNATAGSNPARSIALAAGLPETVSAATIDRQCGSGLDAILSAIRQIGAGEASVIVAGGVESPSTAPWRIAKPKSLYQLPHFIGLDALADQDAEIEDPQTHEAGERLARKLGLSRSQLDAYALRDHLKAEAAREARRFVGEIVPLRSTTEEARDQSAGDPSPTDLERLAAFAPPSGVLTPGNTSQLHDGAAMVVVVDEAVWLQMGRPRALQLLAATARGVPHGLEAEAPIEAMKSVYGRLQGFNTKDIGIIELSESSAAQAIALGTMLGFDDAIVNPDGGAIVRGHALGASGAILVVRLFTRMVRAPVVERPRYGVAVQGTIGGMGIAAIFRAV
jgi:acetyl-CoA C-acetyltransferase